MNAQTSLLPSLPPPDEEAFRYTSARIKVLETKFLGGSDFTKLKNLAPSEKASAIKGHCPWFDGNPGNFIRQSDQRLFDIAFSLAKECNHEDLASLFLLDRAMAQIQGKLEGSPQNSVPVPFIAKFLGSSSFDDLPPELQNSASKADILYKKNEKGDARRSLTSAMVDFAKTSRFAKLPYFGQYLAHWGNLLEVRLFISSIVRKGTFATISTSNMGLSKETSLHELAKKLNVKETDLQTIEAAAEERMSTHLLSARMLTCGPEVVFCYMFELSREHKNLAMILASTQVFVPEQEMAGMLRRPYVV